MSRNYPYLDKVRFSSEIAKISSYIHENGLRNYDPRIQELFQEEMMEWYQFGGRVTKDDLLELRDNILSLAKADGFPSHKSDGTAFDRKLAELLYNNLDITPSMAADIEMWAYLNIILIPDVVKWRWEDKQTKIPKYPENYIIYSKEDIVYQINIERFTLSTRNYLGSLWWSYIIYRYDSNDSEKYDTINADQFTGFFERTNSRGLPNYIHKFVLFLENQANIDHKKVDGDVIREMNKLLKIEFAYRDYMCLTDSEIDQLIQLSYQKSVDIVREKKFQEVTKRSH